MKILTISIFLTLAVLLFSSTAGKSADFLKGLVALNSGDYATALHEWKPLAEQRNALAQLYLGLMYRNGQGVPQNHKAAVKWLALAAEQGLADAQLVLGVLYDKGQGVLQDRVTAHMWLNLAAFNGAKLGGEARDQVAKEMTPSQLEKAQELARECAREKYKGC